MKGRYTMLFNEYVKQSNVTNSSNTKQFTNYISKTAFVDHTMITNKSLINDINELKNCFSFSEHKSLKWLVIQMYYSKTKKYDYLVVDVVSQKVIKSSKLNSIKTCKSFIIDTINGIDTTDYFDKPVK